MEPNVWGPPCWFFLHTISFYYPDNPSFKDKNNFYNFFLNLENVIPCNVCRENYKKNLKEFPITPYLESKKSLIQWVVNLHNLVNRENNKPEWKVQDVTNLYKKIYQEKKQYCNYFQNDINNDKQKELSMINNKKINLLNRKILYLIISIIVIVCIFLILFIYLIIKLIHLRS